MSALGLSTSARPTRALDALRRLAHLALIVLPGLGGCGGQPSTERPNILFVVVDTLRADMVAVPGRIAATPALDELARDGIVFTSAFSHAPMTLPAHAALFSARPPFATGVLCNWQSVDGELPLLAEWLGQHGYATHAVVSLASMNPRAGEVALDRGFETFDRDYWTIDPAPGALARLEKALDRIDATRPFFLFAHFSDPHSPYNAHTSDPRTADVTLDGAPVATVSISDMTQGEREVRLGPGRHVAEFRSTTPFELYRLRWSAGGQPLDVVWEEGRTGRAETLVRVSVDVPHATESSLRFLIYEAPGTVELVRERYIGEVEWMDRFLGSFLTQLRERGLYEETLVVFTSDHGEALGERGVIGHVENLHDEMLHVPLVVKPPREHPAWPALRAARESLVPHADLVPTVLELANVPPLPQARGVSLLGAREAPLLVAQTHTPVAPRDLVCLRDEDFKLIYTPAQDTFEMYDLRADPLETRDVFAEQRGARAGWPEQLRAIADQATGAAALDVSAEEREQLDALGYGAD